MSDQADLFGGTLPLRQLEMHRHSFIAGPRARLAAPHNEFEHSHEDGDRPHQHLDTGPASYTIDKGEWARTTGLVGGGRKEFTDRPTGEQFPIVELEAWQKSFEVVVCDPPKGAQFENSTGPGLALPMRMILGFGMTVSNVVPFPQRRNRA